MYAQPLKASCIFLCLRSRESFPFFRKINFQLHSTTNAPSQLIVLYWLIWICFYVYSDLILRRTEEEFLQKNMHGIFCINFECQYTFAQLIAFFIVMNSMRAILLNTHNILIWCNHNKTSILPHLSIIHNDLEKLSLIGRCESYKWGLLL